jgi:hypothetical protein
MASRCAPPKMALVAVVAWAYQLGLAGASAGDEFDRLDGPPFFELAGRKDAHAHQRLTLRELDALPAVLHDERAALVIVKTDLGNLAKMLVSPGLRKLKPSEKDGPLVPVLIRERFETIDAGDRRSFKARGKELTLFDGFQFDLDAGQVVPDGLGGDIVYLTQGADGPRLAAVDGSRLYTIEKPPAFPETTSGKPSDGRAVVPADFAGRYDLVANGQWSGTLVLAVDHSGTVSGHFRSDRNGSAYPVSGHVAGDIPQKVIFTVQYPRARQDYEGYLWTEGKNAIAGSLSMLDHPYSFIATREGAPLTSGTIDVGAALPATGKAPRRVVRLEPGSDHYTLDGQDRSAAELTETLSQAVKAHPMTAVLLRVADTVPFERVRRAADAVRAAGVSSIKLSLTSDKADSD